ncbi:hypothetical protein U1Q18_017577, partial [Sarracenia purpurea var. burkii]
VFAFPVRVLPFLRVFVLLQTCWSALARPPCFLGASRGALSVVGWGSSWVGCGVVLAYGLVFC